MKTEDLKKLIGRVDEASLSRVWKHFNSDNTIVILTAFRGDKDLKTNKSNNVTVASSLKNAGYGYFFVDGYWIENKGSKDETKVSEDSIFAISTTPNDSALIKKSHELANKYNQDAIFVKTKEEVYLLFKDGSKEVLKGGLKPGKLGDFYTKLRNNKKSNTFVFESERDGNSFFGVWINEIKK